MKVSITVFFMVIILFFSIFYSKPSFNGSTAGCAGGGCHNLQNGIVSATALSNLQIQIQVNGVTSGKKVAGEIVDQAGTVVNSTDGSNNNPFTLTAPKEGTYTINAGFKDPQRTWGTTQVTLATTAIGNEQDLVSASYELFQNYPNPFNPSTTIRFSLPVASQVELAIFNLVGQKVATLMNTQKSAGAYSVVWDSKMDNGRQATSGVYIYRLKTESFVTSKKLMLLK